MVVKIKKQKTQKVCHKKKLKFENYKNCLGAPSQFQTWLEVEVSQPKSATPVVR